MDEQPTTERPKRDASGRWLPGQKPPNFGHNGGRHPGLAARVRKATHEGKDIVEFWIEVFSNSTERTADRLRASELLSNRGWGMPMSEVALTGAEGGPLAIIVESQVPRPVA